MSNKLYKLLDDRLYTVLYPSRTVITEFIRKQIELSKNTKFLKARSCGMSVNKEIKFLFVDSEKSRCIKGG